jgi:hypothetical protein
MTASYLAITLSQALLATMQIYIAYSEMPIANPIFLLISPAKLPKSDSNP